MKPRIAEGRVGFAGGLNAVTQPDGLADNELLRCENVRVRSTGGLTVRPGLDVISNAALGAAGSVMGVFSWTVPAGTQQIVAIANGRLYHATDTGIPVAFTQVIPASGTFSTTEPTDFATFRDTGGNLVLYMASGGTVYTWTGSVLARIDGTNSVPAARYVRSFGTRMFYAGVTASPKTLFWSKIGDGDDCRTGGLSDGGTALVDVSSGDAILGLETIGSSLLIGTKTSIARFSGTADDIQIAQDTQGISADLGILANTAFQRVDAVAFAWGATGPYIVTESSMVPIGAKINNRSTWRFDIVADQRTPVLIAHNEFAHEVWFAYQSVTDSARTSILVYNYRLQCWMGPFKYAVTITSLGARVGGNPNSAAGSMLVGTSNGLVWEGSDAAQDEDNGSIPIVATVEFAPLLFPDVGPHVLKQLRHVFLQTHNSSEPDAEDYVVSVLADGVEVAATRITSAPSSANDPVVNIRYDVNAQGRRFVVRVVLPNQATQAFSELVGYVVQGHNLGRY